jgi:RND superfamily putative drug exporter
MPLFIVGVVGLSFLLLLVAFHSPLISLKAAVMNLLSVSAAYGVMTLVAKAERSAARSESITRCRWRRSCR